MIVNCWIIKSYLLIHEERLIGDRENKEKIMVIENSDNVMVLIVLDKINLKVTVDGKDDAPP